MENPNDVPKSTKATILVVDDTPANLDLIVQILSHAYDVRPSADAAQALLSVQNILPDLVLLDIRMPGMDGYEVCRRLKAAEITRPIPVIFISALDETLDIVKAFSIGAADFVTKPFQAEELLARVATHLSLSNEIKERKKANHVLKKEIAERRAAQQEAEIAKVNLMRQIEKTAKSDKANEAKSEFLANMSHEIRTPMNAIIGLTHLAMKTHLSNQQQDYLTKIQYSSDLLLGIINDILDFSKIEAGKLDIDAVTFDLNVVLHKLENILANELAKKSLTVVFPPVLRLPLLIGDPLRLGQILLNLVKNAITFTAQGAITVSTTITNQTSTEVTLHFTVKDTGIGLTQDHMTRLFRPFSQADVSTTREYGGTGLGLAICKQLVEIMNGQIGVKSAFGVGSTFFFTITLPVCLSPDGDSPLREQNKTAIHALQFHGAKVLVVEDNEINQQITREILEGEHLQVVIACNGAQAVQKIKAEYFDLVLMDLQMPVMDGYQATCEIRKNMDADALPIIAITANAMKGDKEKCLSVGMNGYIPKPISVKALHAALLQWIKPPLQRASNVALVKKILVVDHDRNNIKALARLLDKDYDILFARTVDDACALATANDAPDLILLNAVMPEMAGSAVCRQLQAHDKSKSIPVVFMREQATTEDARMVLESSAIGIIRKPFDTTVRREIQHYLATDSTT